MDALELQKKLSGKLGDDESRDLLRFIEDRPNLATKKDIEKLETMIGTLATREYVEKAMGNLASKVAGFLVAQAAVIVTLVKLL